VASSLTATKGIRWVLNAVPVADGSVTEFYSNSDGIGQPAWLPEGNSLLVPIVLPKENRTQLWIVSFPGGEARRFTNDLSDYGPYLDLTRDGRVLAALESRQISHIWIVPGGQSAQAKQVTVGESPDTLVAAGPAGKLLVRGQNDKVDLMNLDGTQRTPVLPQTRTLGGFSTCGDRYILLDSFSDKKLGLWRTDADGSNPKELVEDGVFPSCSPDGHWILYGTASNAHFQRLSIDGSAPAPIPAPHLAGAPMLVESPDGKWLAYSYKDASPAAPLKIAVISSSGGDAPPNLLPLPNDREARNLWSPDSKGVQYVLTRKGAGNIWEQPLTGVPPRQITNFTSELIFDFAWSRDGKQLYLARGERSSDVILISNFR
jgi:Tol biopolymer transport system component